MMWFVCFTCVLGWLFGYCSTVPMQTAGIADQDIMGIVRSALSSAFHERDGQGRLDSVALRSGFDTSKRNSRLSAMSQLTEIMGYLKNATADQFDRAFLSLHTSVYLSKQLKINPYHLVHEPRITHAWLKLFHPYCSPRHPSCPVNTLRYRTIDGSCNNRHNPTWGMAGRLEKRNLPPDYEDGVDSPRTRGVSGHPLPSPREVSNVIHRAVVGDLVDSQDTIMVMQFGQLLDHDLVDTPMLTGENGATLECCDVPSVIGSQRPKCFPIRIPPTDPRFSTDCMNFARSAFGLTDDCSLGVRDQINQLSSYIDATFLYGADKKNEDMIREHLGGRLFMTRDGFFGEHENPKNCIKEAIGHYCMKAGDRRIHITPTLASTTIMFLREHNHIADGLAAINPQWTDEQLYQTTRKIIVAMTQHITYTEYLPSILDPVTRQVYGLMGPSFGYDTSYDVTIDATVSNSFAVAAFRFGHSTIPNFIKLVNKFHKTFTSNISDTLNRPTLLYGRNAYSDLNRWLSLGMGSKTDQFLEDSMVDDLFLDPAGMAFDLASLNIQRGRDHGIPGYNAWRRLLNLPVATRFVSGPGGFTDINPKTVAKLSSIYESPDDIDLFTGGLSETALPGGSVGPLFAGLLAQQFMELKHGDRFWYENNFPESGFTLDQLNSIKRFTLSKLICNTVDTIQFIQRNVFKTPCKKNVIVPCDAIPGIDLNLWRM